ncbi:hypothetical protein CL635_01705 [bacterium]|nr:hypothetical protein [bacterium]|tara:strand:- start:33664 stop:34695 length:1032 start_codon:yes stop_codon:yes gene_type:complete
MARTYYELLPYAFKRFSLLRTLRTGVPTIAHWATRKPLPESKKPALFTMNIMPPMMTVWYHLVQKNLGDKVDTVIFDCSGTLKKSDFPNARIQKYINVYAATKSDEFLYHIAKTRKIGWVCDDDMFILSDKCLDVLRQEFADPNTASVSFRPRTWWHFDIDGKEYEPSSSYCIGINREIYCNKEHLCLSPCNGNENAVSHIGKPVKRYDTFDRANEILIKKGYNCAIVPESTRDQIVTGFSGVSSAVMLLWYFRSSKKMKEYLEGPQDSAWSGNTMFTILSGLRAVNTMQQMHEQITGKPYHLKAMPSWEYLEKLKEKKAPLIREEHSFDRVDEVAAILRNNL